MNRFFTLLVRWFPKPLAIVDLGLRGHVRMLALTHQRLVLGIGAMPLLGIPFTLWFQGLGRHPLGTLGMLVWTLLYAAAAVGVALQARRLRRELQAGADTDALWLARWQPRVRNVSLAHAVGMGALGLIVLLTPGRATFDFVLVLHVALAVVIVGSATLQLPALGAFLRFYGLGWGIASVAVPLALSRWPRLFGDDGLHAPQEVALSPWRFIIPMSLLLLVALYRHAVIAHNFFLQQVKLEEQGVRLAHDHQAAKNEAQAALQAKNQFLSTASHDLRQPVHAMGLLAESVAVRNHDPALDDALRDLRQGVQSLNLMCNALLDLSRIESGSVRANPQAVALGPLLHDVAALFVPQARARGLDLRVRTVAAGVAETPTVWADPVLLRQSLVNLAHNALRYTVHGGVLLAARRAGTGWRVEVWDTGMGVAAQEQRRIFSPFYRPEHAWRVDSTGHGLGLAVVARCAELMGAGCGVTSRVGQGSRFWLRLEATVAGLQTTLHQPPPAPATHALSGCCLIVEDDPQVASAWRGLLQAWGVEVRCVESTQPALAALDAGFVPNAILCDQRLRSGESGFDVLRLLLERCPAASGAMVSGEFDAPELQQAEAEGYLVLRKPVDTATLHALLATWLA